MVHLVEGYRAILYYKAMPDLKMLGIVFLASLVLLVLGWIIFARLQRRFAEEV